MSDIKLLSYHLILSNTNFADRGVRPVGVYVGKKFRAIPEMIPELIVPDLEGFKVS